VEGVSVVRGGVRVPRQARRVFWRSLLDGGDVGAAAGAAGVSKRTAQDWFAEAGGVPDIDLAAPAGRYLTFEDRERMALLRAEGKNYQEIGRELGRPRSTVWRELTDPARRASDGRYVPSVAQGTGTGRHGGPRASSASSSATRGWSPTSSSGWMARCGPRAGRGRGARSRSPTG
jgi:hypothetical protein